MTFETSADYHFIDVALKANWHPFNRLVAKMHAFEPRPVSDWDGYRRKELARLTKLNPTKSEESLANLVDGQIKLGSSEKVQFAGKFTDPFMAQYVTVALLSHALCEAAINAILAIGLAKHNSPELFSLLERADIKEKWLVGPKSFEPAYALKPGSAIYETLHYLTKRRNALVHYKIRLDRDGKRVLDGSKFERVSFQDDTKWMRRFFSLPYDLAEHAIRQLPKSMVFGVLHDRSPILKTVEHRSS